MFEKLIAKFQVPALITLGVLIITAGAFWAGTIKGEADQKVLCAENKTVAVKEGVKSYGKTKQKIISLPDRELDERFNRWLRD